MGNSVWNHYGDRVKYVFQERRADQFSMFYICLDNKFHSWLADEGIADGWVIRVVGAPHGVINEQTLYVTDWLDRITKDDT